jgi:aryl-alcohol dehydrogenase-like predicted oxidoreductase
MIGRWLQARPGMRDKVKIFTKVGSDLGLPGHKGLRKPGSSRRWTTLCAA